MAACQSRKGFVLIVTCIALTILLGFAAFGIDAGRMYVIKSELQAFSDAAALGAAAEFDGTEAGLALARNAASGLAAGPHAMKWDMGTRPIADIALSFAKGDAQPDPKTWQENPRGPSDYRFVRVIVTAPSPLIFLRVFQPLRPDFSNVAAASVAVKTSQGARLVQ